MPPTTTRARGWWKRVTDATKDKCSICLARASLSRYHSNGIHRNPDLEEAIIKATSHDDTSVDYKNAGRVLSWAKISPSSSLAPLMWALSHRVERTRDWVVALKVLMLAHGVLLCSEVAPATRLIGRLPFDLSNFRDRSSEPGRSWGFTAFVRAYFNFLDHRSTFLGCLQAEEMETEKDEVMTSLERLQRMQDLLELLMQIRPYGNGMEIPLILEAMDCVIIEIFDVYGGICHTIARALITIFGSPPAPSCSYSIRRKGVRILRRATEQNSQLSSYFEVCKGLGVINASQFPAMETIAEEDIRELERLVMECADEEEDDGQMTGVEEEESKDISLTSETEKETDGRDKGSMATVAAREWVVFKDQFNVEKERWYSDYDGSGGESSSSNKNNKNPFLHPSWETDRYVPVSGTGMQPDAVALRRVEYRDLLAI